MANIQVLDQNTINQIAAGEVIERPASVVKELLENAIDAQATSVTVEIRDGGLSMIRVTDNGCGIPMDEVPTAFLRHATSKIRSAVDLITVASLGFRGEALSSIASVAKVELITKTSGSMSGTRYQIEGGEELGLNEVGAPEGTTFIVRDLFYNTPARRKFLKTPMTEGAHVADLVEKISLSHPEVSIRLIQNNQNKLHTSGNHNLKDIIYTVFGREIAANLLPIESGTNPVQVSGFIGKPLIARGNRNFENYFINGRYIKSNLINKAIEDAYKPYMMQHKYPFTMLQFTIDPSFLDVNVHPAKMELRFRDGEMIYKMVYHTISMALSERELIPQVELPPVVQQAPVSKAEPIREIKEPKPIERAEHSITIEPTEKTELKPVRFREPHPEPFETKRKELLEEQIEEQKTEPVAMPAKPELPIQKEMQRQPEIVKRPELVKQPEISYGTQMDLFEDKLLTKPARSEHKLIGQVFDTYWLVEYHDKLYIIDQHAAHEKVLYEKTIQSLKSREYTSQMINPPIILTLNSNEQLVLEKYKEQFTAIGFEIEPFGGKEFAVRAVPANLFSIAKKDLLLEMLDGLTDGLDMGTPDLVNEKIASMSCKAAVKGNHTLSAAEADQLIDALLDLENPYACPHGRPTIITMTKYEMEKKFKRIL